MLFMAALVGATAVTFIPRTASFDLAVSTESVEVVTSSSYKSAWFLNAAQLFDGAGAAPRSFTQAASKSRQVSGSYSSE